MNPDSPADRPPRSALASLRRFLKPRPARERCDLCSVDLGNEHSHLVELASRRLLCACEACAILFSAQGAGKYRRVPRTVQFLADFRLTDQVWEGLGLPINLAFFLQSSVANRVGAFYPSPAGATEALVPPDSWEMLVEDNAVLGSFEPDVEALLVNRLGQKPECFRAGIDECYKLVAVIRMHWRGLSGGPAVWDEMARQFAALKERAHA